MRHSPSTESGRVPPSWLRRHALPVRLAGCFLLTALATVFVGMAPENNLIWVANGVLLSYLLLAPRNRWAAYLCAGMVGQAIGCVLVSPQWQIDVPLVALNMGEVLLAALLLRRRSSDLPRFTSRKNLLRFIGYAVLLAPMVSGAVFTLIAWFLLHRPAGAAFSGWVVSDSLGMAVATPACVAIFRGRFLKARPTAEHLAFFVLLVMVTLTVFMQTRAPLAFLIYPLLMLILLRVGLGWAAMATLFITAAGSWFTVRGSGPFAPAHTLTPLAPSVLLQIFIAGAIFMLYSVSLVLEKQHASERQLREIAALHAMVTENSRDTIIVADFEGKRSWVSPASVSVTGWSAEELMKQGAMDIVHLLDQEKLQEELKALKAGVKTSAVVEVRIQKKTGEYIWVETSLRVVHNARTGAPSGVLHLVRDISERKQNEQRLQDAYNAVEALAVTDGLTGLANRRRFDQCLTAEWRRGVRERTPLSVLMIDADLFKKYNDTYGHPRGDSCLKQIAEAALDVVSRPGDLVARFGGEEFTVVLPNTDNEGAMRVANEICQSMSNRRLPHTGNSYGIVTVSIGCATMIPKLGKHAPDLLEMADQALYQAKHNGRNQVSNGNAGTAAEEDALAVATPSAPNDEKA